MTTVAMACGGRTGLRVGHGPVTDAGSERADDAPHAADASWTDDAADIADTAASDALDILDATTDGDAGAADVVRLTGESCADPIEIAGPGVYSATTIGHGSPFGELIGHSGPPAPGLEAVFIIRLDSPQTLTFRFQGSRDDVGFEMARSLQCNPFRFNGAEFETYGHSPPEGLLLNLEPGIYYFAVETELPEDFTLSVTR
jgi:hypothetical protein